MSANETQVGGDHYKRAGDMQHWDMAAHYQLGYFEGQASKYLTRHRKKHGLTDMRKGLHMLEKLYEVKCAWCRDGGVPWLIDSDSTATRHIAGRQWGGYTWTLYQKANDLTEDEVNLVRAIAEWKTMPELLRIIERFRVLMYTTYPAPDAEEPGPGYVNQDGGAA